MKSYFKRAGCSAMIALVMVGQGARVLAQPQSAADVRERIATPVPDTGALDQAAFDESTPDALTAHTPAGVVGRGTRDGSAAGQPAPKPSLWRDLFGDAAGDGDGPFGAGTVGRDYVGGTIGASFSGDRTDQKVADAYARTFLSQIEPVFPGLNAEWNGRATLDNPFYNPYLRGSYSYYRVGQYTLFGGAEGEASDQCHFAGEHCSQDFQGYIQGGADEGIRAATEIVADYR